jgi:hypothetical protein
VAVGGERYFCFIQDFVQKGNGHEC